MTDECFLLIVGSRSIVDFRIVRKILDDVCSKMIYSRYTVVSGGAEGVDTLAETWADLYHFDKRIFKANWERYGTRAGFIRNEEMHEFISQFPNRLVIAIWDGVSKGTQQNFDLASKYKNPILKFNVEKF